MGDVLQFDWAKGVKRNIGSVADMIAHRLRDADATRRTRSMKPGGHIHDGTIDVSAIRNYIADVDPYAKADGPIGRVPAIIGWYLLLHRHGGATDRAVDAIEHDEEGVASRTNDPTAIFVDCRVDHSATECTEPLKRSYVIQPNQTAVTDHVGIDYGDQLPTAWRSSHL
jgi:hypothetical protein